MTDAAPEPRLTCHVLDVTVGRPAAGVAIEVSRLVDGAWVPVVAARTNADGRSDGPLLAGADLVPGRYELAFAVGDHFGAEVDDRYLDVVPVRIGIAATTGPVHVALLVTPWSYTTYRGS